MRKVVCSLGGSCLVDDKVLYFYRVFYLLLIWEIVLWGTLLRGQASMQQATMQQAMAAGILITIRPTLAKMRTTRQPLECKSTK